jgi:hypothetical protein
MLQLRAPAVSVGVLIPLQARPKAQGLVCMLDQSTKLTKTTPNSNRDLPSQLVNFSLDQIQHSLPLNLFGTPFFQGMPLLQNDGYVRNPY